MSIRKTISSGVEGSLSKSIGYGSPKDISSLSIWFDADDAATIIHSSASVSQWSDKSANSNHATQSNGSLRPVISNNQINNLPSFTIGAVNSYLLCNNNITFQNFTIFAVVKNTRTYPDATNDIDAIFCVQTVGSFPTFSSFNGFVGSDNTPAIGFGNITTTENYINGSPNVAANTGFTVNTPVILAVKGQDTEINTHPMNVLGRSSQSWSHTGPVGEIIFYTKVLSNSEMNVIGQYLSRKWGITWVDI